MHRCNPQTRKLAIKLFIKRHSLGTKWVAVTVMSFSNKTIHVYPKMTAAKSKDLQDNLFTVCVYLITTQIYIVGHIITSAVGTGLALTIYVVITAS